MGNTKLSKAITILMPTLLMAVQCERIDSGAMLTSTSRAPSSVSSAEGTYVVPSISNVQILQENQKYYIGFSHHDSDLRNCNMKLNVRIEEGTPWGVTLYAVQADRLTVCADAEYSILDEKFEISKLLFDRLNGKPSLVLNPHAQDLKVVPLTSVSELSFEDPGIAIPDPECTSDRCELQDLPFYVFKVRFKHQDPSIIYCGEAPVLLQVGESEFRIGRLSSAGAPVCSNVETPSAVAAELRVPYEFYKKLKSGQLKL